MRKVAWLYKVDNIRQKDIKLKMFEGHIKKARFWYWGLKIILRDMTSVHFILQKSLHLTVHHNTVMWLCPETGLSPILTLHCQWAFVVTSLNYHCAVLYCIRPCIVYIFLGIFLYSPSNFPPYLYLEAISAISPACTPSPPPSFLYLHFFLSAGRKK